MKKTKILGVILLAFLATVLLTWIIPSGAFSEKVFTKGSIEPLGILALFRIPISAVSYMLHYGLVILAIGGLYGVLNKTGVYSDLLTKVTKKFKGKEKNFLILSVVMFALLAALTGLQLPLFVLVPFMVSVILLMGYSKMTALLATVGSILIGLLGTLTRYGVNAEINNYYFKFEQFPIIGVRIAFLIVVIGAMIFFVLKSAEKKIVKKDTKKTETKKSSKKTATDEVKEVQVEIPLYEKNSVKGKSTTPLIIVAIIMFIVSLVGMYNWSYNLNVTFFNDMYTKISQVTIGDFAIITKVLGLNNPIGNWGNVELIMILLISSLLIGWLYSVKIKDIVASFAKGAKELLPTALLVTLVGCVLYVAAGSQSGQSFYFTMVNFGSDFVKNMGSFGLISHVTTFTSSVLAALGSFFFIEPYYVAVISMSSVAGVFTTVQPELMGLIFQAMFGVVMIAAPISIVLVAGLSYLDISYKEYIKTNWKLLLSLLALTTVLLLIATIVM